MRPLKPYVLALGGLIAAVFSAVFVGTHPSARLAAPATAPQLDLQTERAAPTSTFAATAVVDREKSRAPQPCFPDLLALLDGTSRAVRAPGLVFEPAPKRHEPLRDRRVSMLVGIVELRL